MVDEKIIAKQYLDGENINLKNVKRICYMLSKYFYEEYEETPVEITSRIFEWAKENDLYLDFRVGSVVFSAVSDTKKLFGDKDIYINNKDVELISTCFNGKPDRIVALAMLCLSKAHSESDGRFTVHMITFADWLGMSRGNIYSRHMPKLLGYGFLEKVNPKVKRFGKQINTISPTFKICFSTNNEGEYKLEGNNIDKLYNDIFTP